MKKFLFVFLFLILCSAGSYADNIKREQASLTARNFLYERLSARTSVSYEDLKIKDILTEYYGGIKVLYIVNFRNGGWVMVPAGSSAPPVMAYSYDGEFTGANVPPQLQGYMESIKSQLSYNLQNRADSKEFEQEWKNLLQDNEAKLKEFNGRSLGPFLSTTWDQGVYYNEMCPADPSGPGGHCLTGCVATAMAQLMNYFRWPDSGTGSYSYSCPPYGTLSADFGSTEYKWDEMPLFLDYSNLSAAEILYHPGVSVDMVYGPNSSGMYNHKAAYSLRTYFKYSPETQYVYRDSTSMDWDSLIMSHLDRKIPMYYAGWSVPNVSGHAFICDGYEEPGYYHFNWGWSGSYDGYFYTEALNPGGSNFNNAQELIIHAFPDTVSYSYPYITGGTDTLTTTAGTIDDGSGPVYSYPNNYYRKWLIAPEDSVNFINIDFVRLETGNNDILSIYDGADTLSPLLGTFTGTEIPASIVSSSDKLLLTFTTDDIENMDGFLLSYIADIPVYCQGMSNFTAVSDTFSDGSGPRDYHNNTSCIWNIHPGNSGKVTLYFNEFNTEEGNDVMKIYDDGVLIATLSGDTAPEPIVANSGKMFITFSTNATVTAPGWEAYYLSDITGLEESKTLSGSVFPVPANDWFRIELPSDHNPEEIEIFSAEGKMVYSENVNDRNIRVNVREFNEGLYLVKIKDSKSGANLYRKLLVKH